MNFFKKYAYLKQASTASLLEESPQLFFIIRGIVIIAVIVLLLIAWASVATIQEVATTYGEIVPIDRVRSIQHLEGGIVKRVLVKDGEKIQEGQLLVQMDETASKAELEKTRSHEVTLMLDKERLQTYLSKKPADFQQWRDEIMRHRVAVNEQEIDERLAKEKDLLISQNEDRTNQEEILKIQFIQQEQQLRKFEHQLQVWNKHLQLLTEEFSMYEKLKEEQYIAHRDYLTILRELNNAQGEQARLIAEITRLKESLIEHQYKLKELNSTLNTAAQKELGTVNDELVETHHLIEKLESTQQHTEVRAPLSGIIKGVRVFAGNVVQPGGLLLEIVPLNQEMLAETRIAPKDIGHVAINDPVVVKLFTYDYARYGSLKGKLIEVSASSFTDDEGRPYYKAVTKLNQQYLLHDKKKKQLIPGMTVEADIVTGQKTLMQYLLKPIQHSTTSAFRER
ncbi:MAG: hypothetical protein A3F41_01420 [Coxiella sp. RIFCSPHIGHO2_12_FULL_44_14]|nr:MAG: hypothetical protein A3F41_01420 [Coxiella sp. RIFCSPHIGHO2_12_FULL_44_14]